MRIIAGTAGSIPLKVPRSLTRPTTDRVREAMFSVLGPSIAEARVLDLFAGSGSLGIEALSRGASGAVFVESNAPACAVISGNLSKARLDGGLVQRRDAGAYLSHAPEAAFDLVFADPPYARDEAGLELLLRLINNPDLVRVMAPGGTLILETLASIPLPETPLWSIDKEKIYGTTRVTFLKSAG